jgi:DNA-binding response OmpR family regulator
LLAYSVLFSPVRKTKRILVVDDEQGIITVLRIKLGHSNYEVITATSGTEAVDLVQTQEPDIVLLDILMPGMNGFEVLEKVRGFSPVPVVAFTAQKDVAESAIKKGADDYITKPFDPDLLIEKIETILSRNT